MARGDRYFPYWITNKLSQTILIREAANLAG